MIVPKVHLRTLMLAIAILAILCGGEVLRRRSTEFMKLAGSYDRLELDCLQRLALAETGVEICQVKADHAENQARWEKQSAWWREQGRRNKVLAFSYSKRSDEYRRAASRPWSHVPPDPSSVPSPEPLLPPPDVLPLE